MSSAKPFPSAENQRDAGADQRAAKFVEIIKTAFSALSEREQENVARELSAAIRPIPAPLAGEVLAAIIRLLPERNMWTVEAIKEQIAARQIGASAKEIYNALGYLTRKRHITRVGYGRYVVDGVSFETADDLGGELSMVEKMDPN